MSIPKVIHQVWIGPKPRPDDLMQTWRDKHPDWEYRLWDEAALLEEFPDGLRTQHLFDVMPEWNGKADLIRYEVLHRFGGVYADADTRCVRMLDDDLLENEMFSSWESEIYRPGLVQVGVVGAVPGAPLLSAMLNELSEKLPEYVLAQRAWLTVGPAFITRCSEEYKGLAIYPSAYFAPSHYAGPNPEADRTFCEQLWFGSRDGVNNDKYSEHAQSVSGSEHPAPAPTVESRPIKVAVYCIGLNEEAHVERWVRGAQGADYIVIADTGSTDRTVELAESLGATVHRITVKPWRFDMARNTALALLPADTDVCISVDMDEWLQPGWREVMDNAWDSEQFGSGKVTLRFVDSEEPDANVTLEYLIDRIHAREGSKWVLPCHEVAVNYYKAGVVIPQIAIHHLPEPSKDRAGRDTPLLELGVRENPNDPRALYYYARQLFYIGQWDSARGAFLKYLGMPEAVFDQERSEACRFIARMVWPEQREKWLLRACYEAPQRREPWAELAASYKAEGRMLEAAGVASRVLGIKDKDPNNSFHIEPFAWDDSNFEEIIKEALFSVSSNT